MNASNPMGRLILASLITRELLLCFPVQAQSIIPDASLSTPSLISPNQLINGLASDRITGGTVRGTNLFHSFREFNIDAGQGAYFEPGNNIANILSRVTGPNPSEIMGTLGVLGRANLFLLNPQGILFGPNARLDLESSFLATSADRFVFGDQLEFSASNPQDPPLLAINMPLGLQFGSTPGSLVNHANQSSLNTGRLEVDAGQTLALVGGEISIINGGEIFVEGGRIELGAVTSQSFVGVNSDLSLDYGGISSFADIILSDGAALNVSSPFFSALGSGNIRIQGQNIHLERASIIGSNFGSAAGGMIELVASDSISLAQGGFISSSTLSQPGGNVLLKAKQLSLTGRAEIQAETFIAGAGGNITTDISELIVIDGTNGLSQLSTQTRNLGKAGNINVYTSQLQILGGGRINSSVENARGDGGQIEIEADSIEIIGAGQFQGTVNTSGIFSDTDGSIARGNGGQITVTSPHLSLQDGATISSATTNGSQGNAGNIKITTNSLNLLNGGNLTSGTTTSGNGGQLTVTSNYLTLEGRTTLADGTTATSGLFATTVGTSASGNGGTLILTTDHLNLSNGAEISTAATQGSTGAPGPLTVTAHQTLHIDGANLETRTENAQNAGNLTLTTGALQVDQGGGSVWPPAVPGMGDACRLRLKPLASIGAVNSPVPPQARAMGANSWSPPPTPLPSMAKPITQPITQPLTMARSKLVAYWPPPREPMPREMGD
jgi:filamentous hemagglutinin family protein